MHTFNALLRPFPDDPVYLVGSLAAAEYQNDLLFRSNGAIMLEDLSIFLGIQDI